MASSPKDIDAAREAIAAGDLGRGERLLRRVLAAAPANGRAHELMAYVLQARGDALAAFEHLQHATRSAGASAAAWHQLGAALRRARRDDEAGAAFQRAIAQDAGFFPAFHDLGVLHYDGGRMADSLEALERAASLNPASFEAFHNLGRTLHKLRRHEEALASYDRALALKPDHPALYLNRGEVLTDLRRYDEALADYARATRIHPGYDDARWNESLTRLLLGDFEAGWPLYECRWTGSMARPRRHNDVPAWKGEDPAGKRIRIWWEQGFGDTIHFCRYAPMLADRGAHVTLEVQPPLRSLLASLDSRVQVFATGETLPGADLQIPLLSLPLRFGTTLENIPAHVPYLQPARARVEEWRARLNLAPGANIGVAVSGHAAQKDNVARSMPLAMLEPLARNATLHVVQVDVSDEDRRFASSQAGRVRLLDAQIRDFEDSAAILAHMDRMVAVDTAVAHLAGSMAVPVSIMLPWTPTWRWMAGREDSPWYPTAHLVRQSDPSRWDDVIARVAARTTP